MEKLTHQYQAIEKEFSKQSSGWNQPLPLMLVELANRLPLRSQDLVLDVAAGSGLVSLALSTKVKHITALDATAEMMGQGKAMLENLGVHNITFRKGYAESLPFDEGSFDVVITRFSFHHFLEPGLAFKEMCRVCNNGGLVVVIDLISPDDPMTAHTYNYLEQLRDMTHTRALTFTELEQLFKETDIQDKWLLQKEMDVEDWLNFTNTPASERSQITQQLSNELSHQTTPTGFSPLLKNDRLKFLHQIATIVGKKIP
ncbi:MAG: methyltransferase domain-containing protein [Cyclobacteriaceae bacterium]|nr:methyltransferase domain-containing protein [Cyclobacteriaceae bacterium]